MPKPTPALFDPLKRLEDSGRRAGAIILTGPERPLQDHPHDSDRDQGNGRSLAGVQSRR